VALCKLFRAVTLTNLRSEIEYLKSISCGLPICAFFLGFSLLVLKEDLIDSIPFMNCFYFGSTRFLSGELDSNLYSFLAESLLKSNYLSGGPVGEAYEESEVVVLGFGIRIRFYFKRKENRFFRISSIEMENFLEEGVLGLVAPRIFLDEVVDDEPFFFFSSSIGRPSILFYTRSISLENEFKCFFLPSLPYFFRFLNNSFFDPVIFSCFFDLIIHKMNYLFFFESFLLSLSFFYSIATVNTRLCEEFIYLLFYEKKLLKFDALADLFFRLYARQRHSEVTTEMLDVFISIFSIELRG